MTTATLQNAADSYVLSRAPSTNYNSSPYLYSSATAGDTIRSALYFGIPFPKGVTILSAKLRLYQSNTLSGSISQTIQRLATSFSTSKVVWNNFPVGTGATVTLTKSSPPTSTLWEFDVTALMQTVSNGAAWYGFRLTSSTSVASRFYSAQGANIALRPTLEITWSDVPFAPTQLYPSGNHAVSTNKPTLQCNFVDISGDKTLQAIQVQINSTDVWTAPSFDSGTVLTDTPELDLSTTAFAGVAAGATVFWRVRVQDGAGLWSNWSASTSFQYQAQGTLTVNSPTSGVIEDATPIVSWLLTGRTQASWEVQVFSRRTVPVAGGLTAITQKLIHTSGKINGTATSYTIPVKVIVDLSITYVIVVRTWDTLLREAVPGFPIALENPQTITVVNTAATSPASSISSTLLTPYPWVTLNWSRATIPDKWNITRNGKVIAVLDGTAPFVSGTSYTYTDRLPAPRAVNTYAAVAVVNGRGSAANPTTSQTPKAATTMLVDVNGDYPVLFYNSDRDMSLDDDAFVFEPTGNAPPIIIFSAIVNGYRGSVKGTLDHTVQGVSAATMRARFELLADLKGQKLYLTIVDKTMEVFILNAFVRPRAVDGGSTILYDAQFDFFQTDAS